MHLPNRFRLVWLVYLLLFLLPVQRADLNLRLPIGGSRYSELIAGGLALVLVLAASARAKRASSARPALLNLLLVLFVCILAVSLLLSSQIGAYTLTNVDVRSATRVQPWVAGATALVSWLLAISAYFAVVVLVNTPCRLRLALAFWVAGAAFGAAIAIYGGFAPRFHLPLSDLFPEYQDPNVLGRIYGLTQEPRQFAIYLITVLPFLLLATIERRYIMPARLQWGCLFLIGAAYLLTLSRSTLVLAGFVGAAAILLPLVVRRRGIHFARSAATLVVIGAIIFGVVQAVLLSSGRPGLAEIARVQLGTLTDTGANASNLLQLVSYDVAWKMLRDHPIFGVGLGNFPFFVDRYIPPIPPDPQWRWLYDNPQIYSIAGVANNTYLDVLAESGIAGGSVFFAFETFLAWLAFRALRRAERAQAWLLGLFIGYLALLVGQLFSSMFTFAFEWSLFGLLYVTAQQAVAGSARLAEQH
jgi:O-antigen ligase